MIENTPLKRLIEPKEVAEVVKFIVGSTLFLNGQNIVLNQGENLI
jgi:NAD(P)-dependent dehydrogenase (short-subunit alcohol dehydrogenase family)